MITLYPKQQEVVTKLLHQQYGLLLGEMGTGKTHLLVYLTKVLFEKGLISNLLLVTKNEVAHKFKASFLENCPSLSEKDIVLYRDDDRYIFDRPGKVYICDYNQFKLCYYVKNPDHSPKNKGEAKRIIYRKTFPVGKTWAVFLDECQAVKSDTSDVHKIIYKNTKEALVTIGSSGTPFEKVEELYSIFRIINEKIIDMSKFEFIHTIAETLPQTLRIMNYKQDGVKKIWKIVEPHISKISKDDMKQMVPKEEIDWEVDHLSEHRQEYQQYLSYLRKEMQRKGQWHPVTLIDPLYKYVRRVTLANPRFVYFDKMVRRLCANEKLLIWEDSPDIIVALSNYYREKGLDNLVIYGNVKKEDRASVINQFDKDPSKRLLIASYLTNADAWEIPSRKDIRRSIYYSLPDSAITYLQSSDRLHRLTSQEPTFVYKLILKDSIDEWARELLQYKIKIIDGVITKQEFKKIEEESLKRYFGIGKKFDLTR